MASEGLQGGLGDKDAVGGPGGIRTLDLLNAIEARSQLRHRPIAGVILQRWAPLVPIGALLVRVPQPEHRVLLEGPAYHLHADGQAF